MKIRINFFWKNEFSKSTISENSQTWIAVWPNFKAYQCIYRFSSGKKNLSFQTSFLRFLFLKAFLLNIWVYFERIFVFSKTGNNECWWIATLTIFRRSGTSVDFRSALKISHSILASVLLIFSFFNWFLLSFPLSISMVVAFCLLFREK